MACFGGVLEAGSGAAMEAQRGGVVGALGEELMLSKWRTTAAVFARLTCDSRVSNASVWCTLAGFSLQSAHPTSRGTCRTAPSKGTLAALAHKLGVFCLPQSDTEGPNVR